MFRNSITRTLELFTHGKLWIKGSPYLNVATDVDFYISVAVIVI